MNNCEVRKIAGEVKRKNIPFYLNEGAVKSLITRVAGKAYADAFDISQMPSENGYDGYKIYCENGKIKIEATSGVAAAVAFDYYLKHFCGYNIGFITTSGSLPDKPPLFEGAAENESAFHYRYLFNYCTFSYSYAFTRWDEWEGILDKILLSGYNLVLNPIGQETVWKKVLENISYTPAEIKRFLVNPAVLPFLWMMNISDYDANYPDTWFDERAELARRFNERLYEFGAGVMLPGYCGMVPDDFKEHFPKSKPLYQGVWNGFPRPAYILPDDPIFGRIADLFYEIQKETVNGHKAHYYSVDPFHEGGITDGIDLADYSDKVLAKMKQHDENAVWFFQGWQNNPKREMLNHYKGDILVGNLLADTNGNGGGDDFAGSPWLYCNVNNFGGQHVLRGNIKRTLLKPFEYAADPNGTLVGIGYLPEAVENDEVFFDIFSRIAIEKNPPDFDAYLRDFALRRYGAAPEAVVSAWHTLADKIYLYDFPEYPGESVFLARPSLDADRTSSWGRGCAPEDFDNGVLLGVCEKLLGVYGLLKNSPSFRFDFVDILRQCNAQAGMKYYRKLAAAFKAGDRQAFTENANVFMRLFDLQTALVSSNENFLLGRWLERAKACGKNEFEKRWFEFHARNLITLWADGRGADLHEYAAREWQGMMEDFYRPRWERFISAAELSLYTGEPMPRFNDYDREITFVYERKSYPLQPLTDTEKSAAELLEYLKAL